jgi:hypothetical protein
MPNVFDFKKVYKDLYLPKTKPVLIDVPKMIFIMIDGKGNPNTAGGAYQKAVEALYGLSYTIKMSKMGKNKPKGYFDYVVPPLEGLWWFADGKFDLQAVTDKVNFLWTAMIRQPDFVNAVVFRWAKEELQKKKPALDLSAARLEDYTEGKCVQILHVGPYDSEPETVRVLEEFTLASGYVNDLSGKRKHHEIYLSDPGKTTPEKLKTVIRHPVKSK